MKTIVSVLLTIFCSATLWAESEYLPIIKEGRTWIYEEYSGYEPENAHKVYYTFCKPQIVDGAKYYSLEVYYENSKDNDVELVKNAHFDTYKFREENGKVYLKGLEPYAEQVEILLIDMTPSSGEPVNCIAYDYETGEPSIAESKVLKIDSIRVNDIIRKRITFPPNQFNSGNDETNY